MLLLLLVFLVVILVLEYNNALDETGYIVNKFCFYLNI